MTTASRVPSPPRKPADSMPVCVDADRLTFGSTISMSFMRTLRVSETGLNALPPGFGRFSLRNVAPLGDRAPASMLRRGGVAAGGAWAQQLRRRPQNYLNAHHQPWLDGFKTASGEVRQFVAAPLGAGATVEEQLHDAPPVGGIQVQVWELTPEALARWQQEQRERWDNDGELFSSSGPDAHMICESPVMGLGAGGRIRQEIYCDTFKKGDWRAEPSARVWVHLVAAGGWFALTGERAPFTPVDADAYISAGLPWFDYYDSELRDVAVSAELAGVKTVGSLLDGGLEHAVNARAAEFGVISEDVVRKVAADERDDARA